MAIAVVLVAFGFDPVALMIPLLLAVAAEYLGIHSTDSPTVALDIKPCMVWD